MNKILSPYFAMLACVTCTWAYPDVKDAAAFTREGDVLMQNSRNRLDESLYQKAEQAYLSAIAIDPKNLDAMIGLAWVRNSEHEFESGQSWARMVLEIDPNNVEAYSLLGDAALEFGNYRKAETFYQKAVNLRPSLSTYSRAAHFLWLTGNIDQGKRVMLQAIKAGASHAENTAWCQAQLALMHLNEGELESANHWANQATEIAPENPLVLSTAAKVDIALGNKEYAFIRFDKSASISPNHDAFAFLYDLYHSKGEAVSADETQAKLVEFHHHHTHSSKTAGHDHSHNHAHGVRGHHSNDSHGGSEQLSLFWSERNLNLSESLSEAEKAYAAHSNISAGEALAWACYKNGDLDRAESIITKTLATGTRKASILVRAGIIYSSIGNWSLAGTYVDEASLSNPSLHPNLAASASEAYNKLQAR